jgi:transcriptional regulator with XRE-family HTH domain
MWLYFLVNTLLTKKRGICKFLGSPTARFVTESPPSKIRLCALQRVETARTFVLPFLPQSRGATAMSLAQRVRDYRYSKGWGPDELANRAEISRTALYQIESGKTELPRAGTLRRIAVALNVPMEDLLGSESKSDSIYAAGVLPASRRLRPVQDWIPSEGGPLTMPGTANFRGHSSPSGDESRFAVESAVPAKAHNHDVLYLREGELMSKLHDLIHSPLGDGVARLVEGLHSLLMRARSSI